MDLPTGTVTFLFTDLEGSTQLWERQPRAMRGALARHDELLRRAFESHGGHVFKTGGDAFCVAFPDAPEAVAAALDAQLALAGEDWGAAKPLRSRMALHTGSAEARDGDYFGPTLNRAARLVAIGHGGQILLSQTVYDLVRDVLPPNMTLRDLGAHRLKDLQRPEHVFEVVPAGLSVQFPPLRSLVAALHNLPLQLTSFIGRERELSDLRRQLRGTRLLTLTGAAGSGKTRLALQLAAEVLEHYPDGIWFLDLASLTDPALVAQTAASTLGLKEQAGRSPTDVLVEHLKSHRLLLVLDNCEHLTGACAALAGRLLRSSSEVSILATSREMLSVAGEVAWPLPPLATPDPRQLPAREPAAALSRYEAVWLFIDRALLVQPAFAVTNANAPAVAEICWQLDGIPLAIELAAARVRVMTVEQIAARLADRFRLLTGGGRAAVTRHQTLRAAIDWSHELLGEQERVLLRRLSVFAGGWTLAAAEVVCTGESIEGWEVLDLQAHLVDKSLVVVDPGVGAEARYRLLVTIRQYAGDRLQEAGEAAAVRDRHRDWFLAWAERAADELRGAEPKPWLERLEQEHDNLRAALKWSLGSETGGEAGLRLAGSIYLFWSRCGYLREGSQWVEAALAAGREASAAARAQALHAAGGLAGQQGDYPRARSLLELALALRRELADPLGLARTLYSLGTILLVQLGAENLDRARALLDEGLSLAREIGDRSLLAIILNNLGELARLRGEYDRARELYEQSLDIRGRRSSSAPITLLNLGLIAFAQGVYEAARSLFEESLGLGKLLGDRGSMASSLNGLAGVHAVRGEHERAARLLGAAEAVRIAIGEVIQPSDREYYERFVAAARAGLDEGSFKKAWAEGAQLSLEQAVELAIGESESPAAVGLGAMPREAARQESTPRD